MGSFGAELEGLAQEQQKRTELSAQEQTDARMEVLRSNFEQIKEVVDTLREISGQKKELVGKTTEQSKAIGKAKQGWLGSLRDHEITLNKQLSEPNSPLNSLLKNAGVDTSALQTILTDSLDTENGEFKKQDLNEQEISILSAVSPNAEEAKQYKTAKGKLTEERPPLAKATEKGRVAKVRALEILKDNQPQNSQPDYPPEIAAKLKKYGGFSTTKKPGRINRQAISPEGRKPVTFENLITALEEQQRVLQVEYKEILPKSTKGKEHAAKEAEGREQTEKAKQKLSNSARSFYDNHNHDLIQGRLPNEAGVVTVQVLEAEKQLGRDQTKHEYLESLRQLLDHEVQKTMLDRLGGLMDIEATRKQIDYFNNDYPEKRTEIARLFGEQMVVQRRIREKIRAVIEAAGPGLAWHERFEEQRGHTEEQTPPLFHRRLNNLLSYAGESMGLVNSVQMFYQGPQTLGRKENDLNSLGLLERFNKTNDLLTSDNYSQLFPENAQRIGGMRKTEIVNPDFIIEQLKAWQTMLATFESTLDATPESEKEVFLLDGRPDEISSKTPPELKQKKLDQDKRFVTMPEYAYVDFARQGLENLRRKFKKAQEDAKPFEDRTLNKVGIRMDIQFAERDIKNLEADPETAKALVEAKQIAANKKASEELVLTTSGEWYNRKFRELNPLLANDIINVKNSEGRITIEDVTLAKNKSAAEATIKKFNLTYASRDAALSIKAGLEEAIGVFKAKNKTMQLFSKRKNGEDTLALAKIEADLSALAEAERNLINTNLSIDKVAEVNKVLAEQAKNGFRLVEGQLNELVSSQNSTPQTQGEFLTKFQKMLVAMRKQEMTKEQKKAFDAFTKLQEIIKTKNQELKVAA